MKLASYYSVSGLDFCSRRDSDCPDTRIPAPSSAPEEDNGDVLLSASVTGALSVASSSSLKRALAFLSSLEGHLASPNFAL